MSWYTICVCYPDGRNGEGETRGSCVRELMGGPLDGLVIEADEGDLVWTIPVFFATDEYLNMVPSSGEHVYAYRRSEPGKMFYTGVLIS